MSDAIFEPLTFRNPTLENRILGPHVADRFDNHHASGNQVHVTWGLTFAHATGSAIRSSFVSVFHPAAHS